MVDDNNNNFNMCFSWSCSYKLLFLQCNVGPIFKTFRGCVILSVIDDLKRKKDQDAKINVFKTFYVKTNIDFKTRLKRDEIVALSTLETVQNYLKTKFNIDLGLIYFTEKFKAQLVSLDGLGRSEMVEVLKERDEEEQKKKGLGQILGVK